jgi:hypothetical protein
VAEIPHDKHDGSTFSNLRGFSLGETTMPAFTARPTRTVLDTVAGRTLTFLIGVNTSIEARTAFMARGYTQEEHQHIWSLLGKLAVIPTEEQTLDTKVLIALSELNAWDEPNLPVIESILVRSFPEQAEFVCYKLAPSPIAAQAALTISTLLDRFDQLENGAARKSTRKQDHAALERLSDRGYTKEVRKHLRALLETTKTVTVVEPLSTEESDAIKIELWGFLNEWTTQAKVLIKRRDILLRLGIGKRNKRAATPANPPIDPTTPTAPTTAGAVPSAPVTQPTAPIASSPAPVAPSPTTAPTNVAAPLPTDPSSPSST